MDDETRQAFADLMKLINDGNGRLMNRMSAMEGELRDLRTKHDGTRDLVMGLPAAVVKAVEEPMLRRLRDIEGRVTRLEEKK
jgi:hypothetical protein